MQKNILLYVLLMSISFFSHTASTGPAQVNLAIKNNTMNFSLIYHNAHTLDPKKLYVGSVKKNDTFKIIIPADESSPNEGIDNHFSLVSTSNPTTAPALIIDAKNNTVTIPSTARKGTIYTISLIENNSGLISQFKAAELKVN